MPEISETQEVDLELRWRKGLLVLAIDAVG